MIDQLNNGGKFTDQNYEGSNMAAILDILAYYTHVLMFYLNQTSSESMFSQTQIYENMNRIVKLIDYKPVGQQTSLCPINCLASSGLSIGSYLIKKYSYFLVDNIQYTFLDDYIFEKTTTLDETITSINDNVILYQGVVKNYPTYTATGTEYEILPIVVDNITTLQKSFISHGSISVYVKEFDNDTWYEYTEVDTIFTRGSTDRVFSLRLNENGYYEVKFGNGIFGKRLNAGDEVSVFYILSDDTRGIISKNAINGNKVFVYNNPLFIEIYGDVNNVTNYTTVDNTYSNLLIFNNPSNSTPIKEAETVDQIRENSPIFLSSQLRLVTASDYERYLKINIPSIISDVKVIDNNTFISEYISYFYNICVDPNKVNRVLLNQVNYADSCDFNNVNIFCVPKFTILNDGDHPSYLSNSFKSLILDITKDNKIIGQEVVPRDPIYVAVDIGYSDVTEQLSVVNDSKLVIYRTKQNKKSKERIRSEVSDIIVNYFSSDNMKLGQTIDLNEISSQILKIDGVRKLQTVNNINKSTYNGVTLSSWVPLFDKMDENIHTQNFTLEFYKYPFIANPKSLINKIEIVDE